MGKFTDTKYSTLMDNLIEGIHEHQLKNPFYKFTDKNATKVTYYRQNIDKTTTEYGSEDIYQTIGKKSPIKYNKINGFYIYGIDRIDTNAEITDYGLETDEISGDAIVLPKTIVPADGDYFVISYVKEDILFQVTASNSDSLANGQNFYQIKYQVTKSNSIAQIEAQVVEEYDFLFSNVGTDFTPILEVNTRKTIEGLENVTTNLMEMFKIFFNNNVQNFVYEYNGFHMYDPYLIEFLLRNGIMDSSSNYIHIAHGAPVNKTFAYDYSRSWFHLIENPDDMGSIEFNAMASATAITEINTLFATRLDCYYKIDYFTKFRDISTFSIFPAEVMVNIHSGEYFGENDSNSIFNLLIAHLHNDESYFTGNMLNELRLLQYMDNKEYFYLLPVYIYIINRYIGNLMK